MIFLQTLASRLTPTRTTFLVSLLLSLVAWMGSTVNRDGMLYVKAGYAFLDGGFAAAQQIFSWPFLPVAMGAFSKVFGLSVESSGYLLNAFFMAGACSLMVACIERRHREVAWMACITVLSLPGLNEYRNELLREYGCWFFVMLSFWLALRWSERPCWLSAFAVQGALCVAGLFRPEALALFPALIAWQWFEAPRGDRWRRLTMLGAVPCAGAVALVTLRLGGGLEHGRLAGEFSRINTTRFEAKAQILASALIDYAQDQARTILFFGSLALVPLKLINKFGIYLLPLIFFLVTSKQRLVTAHQRLFAWAILLHLLVLATFTLDLQFLAGRYVAPVLLFSTPFVAAGLHELTRRFPRQRVVVIALALLLMASHVISTGPGKTYFVEAGRWLAGNAADTSSVYIDSGRAAYHAGWLNVAVAVRNDPPSIEQAIASGKYKIFVLEVSRKDPPIDEWLQQVGLHVIQRFEHPNHDAVLVAELVGRTP